MIVRRNETLRLSETINGTRFPLKLLNSRPVKLRWNNPRVYDRRLRNSADLLSYKDSKGWDYQFTSCLIEESHGLVFKTIYRGMLTLDRSGRRFSKKATLNQSRGLKYAA